MIIDINNISGVISIIEGDELVYGKVIIGRVVSDYSRNTAYTCNVCILSGTEYCKQVECHEVHVEKVNEDSNTYNYEGRKMIDMNQAMSRVCNSDICPFHELICIGKSMLHDNSDSCIVNVLFREE